MYTRLVYRMLSVLVSMLHVCSSPSPQKKRDHDALTKSLEDRYTATNENFRESLNKIIQLQTVTARTHDEMMLTRHDTTRHDTTRHDTIRYDRYETIRVSAMSFHHICCLCQDLDTANEWQPKYHDAMERIAAAEASAATAEEWKQKAEENAARCEVLEKEVRRRALSIVEPSRSTLDVGRDVSSC